MKLEYSELENGIRLIALIGVLDLNGTYSVEVPFVQNCSGEKVRVIVDLSKVSYISSVGIPMLVNTAKSVRSRGGKIVFLDPQENVLQVLELVGISHVVPVLYDQKAAVRELQNPT
jgi:anti-sigma B factor antagonist